VTKLEVKDYRFCPQCFEAYPFPAHRCPDHKANLVRLRYPEGSLKGRLIDRKYIILDLLGRGGMGVVYRARQMPIKREVAFKVLGREFLKHPASVKRFIREASAASMLRSRFSTIIHDFGLAREGFLYFTMEVARGNLLSDLTRGATPMELEEACLVATDICRSLEEAHGFGIIHRDIKPANIMLSKDEDQVLAKVLDFGTARLVESRDPERITDPGKVFGTPEYMSPEQAMGEDVGPTADLYSLGVMLYEMIAGVLPFAGRTHTHLLLKQIREKPRSLQAAVPERDVPAPLNELVAALLQKNPRRRPQSARDVRQILATILHEHFPHAEPSQSMPSPEDREDGFVPASIHSVEPTTRRETTPRDEGSEGRCLAGGELRRLLFAVAIFLAFSVLITGGWRLVESMMDDRSEAAHESEPAAPQKAKPGQVAR